MSGTLNMLPSFMSVLLIFLISSCGKQRNPEQLTEASPEYAIAYNVLLGNSTDNYEVFTMNMDGSDKTNITNLPGVEWTYLSYQDKVYFISDKDTCHRCYRLYQTDYQGRSPKRIYSELLADSWMSTRKEGSELIIKTRDDSAFHIIDLNGKILRRTGTGLPFSGDPLFVNEGKQIVFRGGQTKSKLIEGFNEALYIIDEDGSNLRRLTTYPETDTTAGKFGYKAGPPKLHPTGNYITYQSKQNGKYSLFAVTLDGKQNWRLTKNTENEGWHDWSPDGKWLAIELFDDNQTQFHIGLMNWETEEMMILTDSTYTYQQSPNFVSKN